VVREDHIYAYDSSIHGLLSEILITPNKLKCRQMIVILLYALPRRAKRLLSLKIRRWLFEMDTIKIFRHDCDYILMKTIPHTYNTYSVDWHAVGAKFVDMTVMRHWNTCDMRLPDELNVSWCIIGLRLKRHAV